MSHPFVVTKFNLIDVCVFPILFQWNNVYFNVPFSFDYYDPNMMFSLFNELVRTHFEME